MSAPPTPPRLPPAHVYDDGMLSQAPFHQEYEVSSYGYGAPPPHPMIQNESRILPQQHYYPERDYYYSKQRSFCVNPPPMLPSSHARYPPMLRGPGPPPPHYAQYQNAQYGHQIDPRSMNYPVHHTAPNIYSPPPTAPDYFTADSRGAYNNNVPIDSTPGYGAHPGYLDNQRRLMRSNYQNHRHSIPGRNFRNKQLKSNRDFKPSGKMLAELPKHIQEK